MSLCLQVARSNTRFYCFKRMETNCEWAVNIRQGVCVLCISFSVFFKAVSNVLLSACVAVVELFACIYIALRLRVIAR